MEALERSTAHKLAEARQNDSPGFQDFTSPQFIGSRKKRHLPLAPRKRASTEGEEGKVWSTLQS